MQRAAHWHKAKVGVRQTAVVACQQLLHGRNLTGRVTTMDARLTDRELARQIRRQGGHYVMVVTRNHPLMQDDVAAFCSEPHLPADAPERYACATHVTKGHGRLEVRTVECITGWCMDWH